MFVPGRISQFIFICVFVACLLGATRRGRSGKLPKLRRLAGLDAIEEAVGRATEFGRPVLTTPGLVGLESPATLAGLSMVGYVARLAARYSVPFIEAQRDHVIYPIAQEIVRQAYLEENKGDAFDPSSVRFIPDRFGYVVGMMGIIDHEKPAANIFIGHFLAESLIFAEAGWQAGAMQVAGTDREAQIPFFVAVCDYVLIGEEIYAASAYINKDPKELAAIATQDWVKWVISTLVIVGSVLQTVGNDVILRILAK